MAYAGTQRTLVYVQLAMLAGERRRAPARIAVDTVHTGTSVLAQISRTIVDVDFAIRSFESCERKNYEKLINIRLVRIFCVKNLIMSHVWR